MSENEVFECDKCDKKFTTKFSLARHQFIHSNVKKFTCKFCPKKFALKQYLKEHECIHTDDRPFVCGVGGCQMRFRQRGKLSLHRRKHKGYKMKEYTLIRNPLNESDFGFDASSFNEKVHSYVSNSVVGEHEDFKKTSTAHKSSQGCKGKRGRKAKLVSLDSDSDFELPSQTIKIKLAECKRSLRCKPTNFVDSNNEYDDFEESEEVCKKIDNEEIAVQTEQDAVRTENKVRKFSNDSTHDASHCAIKQSINKRTISKFRNQTSTENSSSKFSVLVKAFKIYQNLKSVDFERQHDGYEESKFYHPTNLSTDKCDETVSLNNISKMIDVSGLESTKNGDEVNISFECIRDCLSTIC